MSSVSRSRRQGQIPPKPNLATLSITAPMGALWPSVAVLMEQRSRRSSKARNELVPEGVECQETAHACRGEVRVSQQTRLVGQSEQCGKVGQRAHGLRTTEHHEVALVAVQKGEEHDAGFVELGWGSEDQAAQGNRRRENPIEGFGVAPGESCEGD